MNSIFAMNEHELKLDGIDKISLDLDNVHGEVELETACFNYSRNFREDILYDPMLFQKLEELWEGNSTDDLEKAHSFVAQELFHAKQDFLLFQAQHGNFFEGVKNPAGNEDLISRFETLKTAIEDAIQKNVMLEMAISCREEQ